MGDVICNFVNSDSDIEARIFAGIDYDALALEAGEATISCWNGDQKMYDVFVRALGEPLKRFLLEPVRVRTNSWTEKLTKPSDKILKYIDAQKVCGFLPWEARDVWGIALRKMGGFLLNNLRLTYGDRNSSEEAKNIALQQWFGGFVLNCPLPCDEYAVVKALIKRRFINDSVNNQIVLMEIGDHNAKEKLKSGSSPIDYDDCMDTLLPNRDSPSSSDGDLDLWRATNSVCSVFE